MREHISCGERGEALSPNDGAIAALKDIHKGKVVWLIGNGSRVRIEDLERLKGQVSFGCNRLYLAYDKKVACPKHTVFSST